jgi:hypothetical protein
MPNTSLLSLVMVATILSLCDGARAEPVPFFGQPCPDPQCGQTARPALPTPVLSAAQLDLELMRRLPDFRRAHGRRRAGTLLSAIGGGVGATLVIGGGIGLAALGRKPDCSSKDLPAFSMCGLDWDIDRGISLIAIGTGAVVAVVSLAVGLPLALSSTRKMDRMRSEARRWMPSVSLVWHSQRNGLGLGWTF